MIIPLVVLLQEAMSIGEQSIPKLNGIYFFGDFCNGTIMGLKKVGEKWESTKLIDTSFFISSFGQDNAGNVYVVDYFNGHIYRILEKADTVKVVTMKDSFFSPYNITINVEDIVRWVNKEGNHTTTSGADCISDGKWNSGLLSPLQSFEFTFTEPGTYPYFCISHCSLGMKGVIHVNESTINNPEPDIKANNSDNPITIGTVEELLVTISINSGDRFGENADYWVLAKTMDEWYYYDYTNGGNWRKGNSVAFQYGIKDLFNRVVLKITGLPEGIYTFYFGVDMEMNGILDNEIFQDNVEVNVSDN